MSDSAIPDYTGHEEKPSEDSLTRLRRMALEMIKLDTEIEEFERLKKELEERRNNYAHTMIPELMKSIGVDKISITGSAEIVVEDKIRIGKLPADGRWKQYLAETGNDGMIKREFTVSYGRDSTKWAEAFSQQLKDMGVGDHAEVKQSEEIHHSTLAAFLKKEVKEKPEVAEIFGVYVQTIASIKSK